MLLDSFAVFQRIPFNMLRERGLRIQYVVSGASIVSIVSVVSVVSVFSVVSVVSGVSIVSTVSFFSVVSVISLLWDGMCLDMCLWCM